MEPRTRAQAKTIYNPELKIWSGVRRDPVFGPECSIGQVALECLLKNPEYIGQICANNGKSYTNREIANLSIRVAQHFEKLKIPQSDVIGLCASNSDYIAPLVFGALLSGLTISTLDPSFDKDGIKHTFSITKPKIIFCDGGIYQDVKAAVDELELESPIYTMKDHIAGFPDINEFLQETGLEKSFKCEPLKNGWEQTAMILCTSGTTGLPKGVCMSHGALLNNKAFDMYKTGKLLVFSTLYWATGVKALLSGTMDCGTRVISDRNFCVDDFLEIVSKYKITSLVTTPPHLALTLASPKIKEYDLSSVTTYILGGAAVPYVLIEEMKKYMPNANFVVGYGMSEVTGAIASGLASPKGSTGQLAANIDMKIIDDDGKHLGPNEAGEICIRSTNAWAGYYGNPKATAEIFENNEWIHSGDVGYFDDDGDLFIVDRKRDIYRYNNFQYTPSEIEAIIIEMRGIAEVCVFGIPDMISSTQPAAAIIKKEGCDLTEKDIADYVSSKIPHFKDSSGGIHFLSEFPKTASGKIQREKVLEICENLRKTKEKNQKNGI